MPRPRKADWLATDASDDQCDIRVVHIEAVRTARLARPASATLATVADLFAALGDPTRLRIVAALAEGELCVCDLAALLSLSDSAVSHQLRYLRNLGLVRARRDHRLVYYTLDDDHVGMLYRQALDHVSHTPAEVA